MARVQIITESSAHLDPELIARHRITILPVEVEYGGAKYLVDLDEGADQLFRHMAGGAARPAQVSISSRVFQHAYSQLSQEAEEILVIVSSSRLSRAYDEARAATRAFLGRCRIVVLDSTSASWGLGLVVKAAVRMAEEGRSVDDIVRVVRGMLPHIYLVFLVERLDYLELKGRIGQAQALLGTMLHIKPLLLLEEGDIVALEKVRTRLLAVEKLADFVAEFAAIQQVVLLKSRLDNGLNDLIDPLREQLSLALPGRQFPVVNYDAMLACHVGPEAVGIAVYEGMRGNERFDRIRS